MMTAKTHDKAEPPAPAWPRGAGWTVRRLGRAPRPRSHLGRPRLRRPPPGEPRGLGGAAVGEGHRGAGAARPCPRTRYRGDASSEGRAGPGRQHKETNNRSGRRNGRASGAPAGTCSPRHPPCAPRAWRSWAARQDAAAGCRAQGRRRDDGTTDDGAPSPTRRQTRLRGRGGARRDTGRPGPSLHGRAPTVAAADGPAAGSAQAPGAEAAGRPAGGRDGSFQPRVLRPRAPEPGVSGRAGLHPGCAGRRERPRLLWHQSRVRGRAAP